MTALLALLTARVPMALALLLAGLLFWQSARIEGLPLLYEGLKARIATLDALADARADMARMGAQIAQAARGQEAVRTHLAQQRKSDVQIQTVIREVPVYVSPQSDQHCILPWGAVRLLDAAASGADPARLRDHIAPGQPDDAASGIALSEIVALLAANLGIARANAGQLEQLQRAVTPEE